MVTEETADGLTRPVPLAELPGPLGLAVVALEKVVPIVDRLAGLLARFAAVGAAGAVVIWGTVAERWWPSSPVGIAVVVALALVLLVPTGVLLAYRAALRRYAAAADQLRQAPTVIGQEANRVHRALADVRATRGGGIFSTFGALRQLVGTTRAFEEQVNAYTPLVAAANPAFIAAALAAVVLAVIEAVIALPLLFQAILG